MAEIPDVLLRQLTVTLERASRHIASAEPDLDQAMQTELDDLIYLLDRYKSWDHRQENDDSDVDSIAI